MAKETNKPAELPQKTSIHIAIACINRDIVAVQKDRQNTQQGFNFRGIDDLYNALHPIFAANGVVCVPTVHELTAENWLNAKGNRVNCARLKMSFDFVATDGSKITATTYGEGFDFADKAVNKAMSAAQKYALLQTFLIPTADMPDADRDTITQTVDPLANPYAGKSLPVLEAMRDEVIKAGGMPEKELLGAIAELRVAAQDASLKTAPEDNKPAATQTQPAAPSNGPPAPAKETKPKKEKAEKPAQEPAKPQQPAAPPAPSAPAAGADTPPGAVGDEEEFGEGGAAPAGDDKQAAMSAALALVVTEDAVKHKDYVGKKLGDLEPDQIRTLHEKWALKFADQIKGNKVKEAVRDAVALILATLPPAPPAAA